MLQLTLSMERQGHCKAAVRAARGFKDEFAYSLLPTRLLHPTEALQYRQAVLLALVPMLADVEKQRKIDEAACQTYTRCRIESRRTRTSWYQYSDVDSMRVIDPAEYKYR
jgi:hypothetical protein